MSGIRNQSSPCPASEPAPTRKAGRLRPPLIGNDRGFTLIELLVALGIIGVISAVGARVYVGAMERARVSSAMTEIRVIEKMIEPHLIDEGTLPLTLEDLDWNNDDPWGRPYVYVNFGDPDDDVPDGARLDKFAKPLNTYYDLYSTGKDGSSDPQVVASESWDDVLRASDGAYVGLASEF